MNNPMFHIGEIVLWENQINDKYVKIVTIFKIETECNNIFYRYGGVKQVSNCKYENIEYYITNSIFDEKELKPVYQTDLSHIIFERYTMYMPKSINRFSSNKKYSIDFENTIDSSINIKNVYESVWSTQETILGLYKKDILTHTSFLCLNNNGWESYKDINTNDTVYVNHSTKLVSSKPVYLKDCDATEHSEFIESPKKIAILRKLMLLLYSRNCEHIIDIIKDCVMPTILFSYKDVVYNNDYEKNFSNVLCIRHNISEIRERQRVAKQYHMIIKKTFLLKDANKLWKVRYLVQSAYDDEIKCGYCDQDSLSKAFYSKNFVLFDNKPINSLWEDGYYQTQKAKNEYCLFKHNSKNEGSICCKYMETDIFLNNELVLNKKINNAIAIFNSSVYIPLGTVCSNDHNFNIETFIKKRKMMIVEETKKIEYYKFYNFSKNLIKKQKIFPIKIKNFKDNI